MKNVFRIVSVFVGTVIGAGFASGKELLTFFCGIWIQKLLWYPYLRGVFCSARNGRVMQDRTIGNNKLQRIFQRYLGTVADRVV